MSERHRGADGTRGRKTEDGRPRRRVPGPPKSSQARVRTPTQSPVDAEAMDVGLLEAEPADPDFLYRLLPRILRNRDAGEGQPLRALMRVLNRQYELLYRDVEGLYENWFIETCDEWVVPYLGELVGLSFDRRSEMPWDVRAFVANAIAYRCSKGTPETLRATVRDATGWPAWVVEPYRRVAATPTVVSPGTSSSRTVDLRDALALSALGGPRDRTVRTARVERLARSGPGEAPPELPGPRLGSTPDQLQIYLWRLQSFPVSRGTARKVDAGLYTFDPFGIDRPLFFPSSHTGPDLRGPELLGPRRREPARQPDPDDPRNPAGAAAATYGDRLPPGPGPLDPDALRAEIEALRQDPASPRTHFGPRPAFRVWVDGEAIPPEAMEIRDLSSWQRPPAAALYRQRSPGDPTRLLPVRLAVDPRRGRLAFAGGREPQKRVQVSYSYGLAGDLGGGPYPRRVGTEPPVRPTFQALVGEDLPPSAKAAAGDAGVNDAGANGAGANGEGKKDGPDRRPRSFTTLWQALEAWETTDCDGHIRILDSALHALGRQGDLELDLDGRRLVIEAGDGEAPALWGRLRLRASRPSHLLLSGLWLDSPVEARGEITLHLRHSTAQPLPGPGRPSLRLAGGEAPDGDGGEGTLRLWLESSIVGSVLVFSGAAEVVALDSVVDGSLAPARAASEGDDPPGDGSGARSAGAADASDPHLAAELLRCTFFGPVELSELRRGEELLFTHPLKVERREGGGLRYSYVPPGSRTPPRHQCQPDVALKQLEGDGVLEDVPQSGDTAQPPGRGEAARREILGRMRPVFTSTRFGRPGYAQLSGRTPAEIRNGGRGGSEMGVFHRLRQSRREEALASVLAEFVPWGLDARVRYVT